MSDRINVGATASAFGGAIQAGTAAAVASLRYDRAIASQRQSLAEIDAVFLQRARARVATRELRDMLGL